MGCLLESADDVLGKKIDRVFAAVRPPGHHAEAHRAMGFCLFNNVAVAAAYAIAKKKVKRVAIYDFDVHHGNGTQSIFYDRPDVLYLSHHQYPFFPGTGDWDETGKGDGQGTTLNCPLAAGSGDEEMLYVWDFIFRPVIEEYSPDLLLLSAGFDAHHQDPLGGLTVTDRGYRQLFSRLETLARKGKIPLIYALEGGYSGEVLAGGAKAMVAAYLQPEKITPTASPGPACLDLLSQARNSFNRFWKF